MATANLIDPAIDLLNLDLPAEDGEPLESPWHRAEINLLIESLYHHWRDRSNFYAGGNMFIYYSLEQVRRRSYRGPDFFVVLKVDGDRMRDSWVVWEEDGRYPNVIVELLSPTTAVADKTTKKALYEQTFHTPEYFCYDPGNQELVGWRIDGGRYGRLRPKSQGRLWSKELGLWLGLWRGVYLGQSGVWLRFYTQEGELVLTGAEAEAQRAEAESRRANLQAQRADTESQRADTESQRADTESQRADTESQRADLEAQRAEAERLRAEQAEAEVARLRAALRSAGIDPDAGAGS